VLEEFQRITDVCYHGFVWGTRAALARMRPRNRGTIIQVGSALAYRTIPLQSAYCGAKHAIHGFTDSVRSEFLHDKVNIDLYMVQLLAVTPQFDWCVNRMDKSLHPVPPIFQPEIIAEAIHHASLHPRREIFLAPHGANAPGERPAQPSHLDYESLQSTTTCRHLQKGR
jgi:NADP-dependent 3-hydroxy acid dehydrogenase YdfG